jgi:phosphatidylinositol glycan class C protein
MGTDPDNYTDEYTFLDHLQRNPRLQPYQFWRLVADSTVIVQHVSTVAIFICCFTGIFQERVSPVTVVSWGTVGTVIGWVLWDFWVGQEDEARLMAEETETRLDSGENFTASSSTTSMSTLLRKEKDIDNKLVSGMSNGNPATRPQLTRATSAMSLQSNSGTSTATSSGQPTGAPTFATYTPQPLYGTQGTDLSPRSQQRLSTAKSAILIYCAVLGLSPILKSLTKSTSSDSIWAISCWLFVINVFFFDYGGGVGAK